MRGVAQSMWCRGGLGWMVRVAGVLGFLVVALGAFGAHGLKGMLEGRGSVGTWETAVFYHALHALALLGLAGVCRGRDAPWPAGRVAGILWVMGVVCFSGSLYALALGGPRWLAWVTPVGGLLFLAGWGVLCFCWRHEGASRDGACEDAGEGHV